MISMYNLMVTSFIKLLIKSAIKSAIKSTYILENSLVRHVHIYDGILNDVNISATKTFRTFRQLTFFSFFPGKHAFRPHYFIMYPKAILPQQQQQLWSHCKVQLELKSPGRWGPFLLKGRAKL